MLMAYREDTTEGKAGLYLTELDPATFQPVGVPIRPIPARFSLGTNREDPRLFLHDNRLHVVFAAFAPHGYPGGDTYGPGQVGDPRLFGHDGKLHLLCAAAGGSPRVRQLFSCLRDDLTSSGVWEAPYEKVQVVEKNWAPWSCNGRLLAVYSHSPWVIIDCHTGEEVSRLQRIPWRYGEPRGGAPPVLVGDEYVAWFHGTALDSGLRRYTVGVVTFEAAPPFRPLRVSPRPVLLPDEVDRESPTGLSCVFPCGAYLDGERWVVSAGYQDREARVYVFDREEVERQLVKM